MSNFTIKKITNLPKDVERLVDLSENEGYRFVRKLVNEWASGKNRFDNQGEIIFGAFLESTLVGVCGLNQDPYTEAATVGRLRHLYVDAEYRNMGIARSLVSHCLSSATQYFKIIRIRTPNECVNSFYSHIGFNEINESTATHELIISSKAHDHDWLEPYAILLQDKVVLELGCGPGIDTAALLCYAKSLISGDIAPTSDSHCVSLLMDHSKGLPFRDGAFDTVVASLCLHYFEIEKTKQIITEISRVLKPCGNMICRLNSYKDENYGAMGYPIIEPGLYDVRGEQKRFFKEPEIRSLWTPEFSINEISHKSIDRYQKPKWIYEFSARSNVA